MALHIRDGRWYFSTFMYEATERRLREANHPTILDMVRQRLGPKEISERVWKVSGLVKPSTVRGWATKVRGIDSVKWQKG